MELSVTLTGEDRSVSPAPTGPNAFFGLTHAKAWVKLPSDDSPEGASKIGFWVSL
jgi:hypothetical protein